MSRSKAIPALHAASREINQIQSHILATLNPALQGMVSMPDPVPAVSLPAPSAETWGTLGRTKDPGTAEMVYLCVQTAGGGFTWALIAHG